MPNDYLHTTWSRAKRLKMVGPSYEGEDIVCSIWRHIAGYYSGRSLANFAEQKEIHYNRGPGTNCRSHQSTTGPVHSRKVV